MFLARPQHPLVSYRARRHLEARNTRFKKYGWLDCETDLTDGVFSYRVVAAGGSELIQRKVLIAALDGERDVVRAKPPIGFVDANYRMAGDGDDANGLKIRLEPKRRDKLLFDGWLVVSPEDGALVELRGRLSKSPSFWTTRVDVIRRFQRIADTTVPVRVDSVAAVRFAGESEFSMDYVYDTINGVDVGARHDLSAGGKFDVRTPNSEVTAATP